MLYMIDALLGGPVKRPCRNRGIYSVFPNPGKRTSLGPHVDGNHNEMMCVTLLRDVEPRGVRILRPYKSIRDWSECVALTQVDLIRLRCAALQGGFTMWPTSAQRLYPTSEQALHWVATPRSEEVVKNVLETVRNTPQQRSIHHLVPFPLI